MSSPGIDRLALEQDFERYAGEVVDITLKAPMGAAAAREVAANRRKFRGTLEKADGGWQLTWSDEPRRRQEGIEEEGACRCRCWVSRWTSSRKRVWHR